MADEQVHDYDYALSLIAKEREERTGWLNIGRCGIKKIPPEIAEMNWLWGINLGGWFVDQDGKLWRAGNLGIDNRFEGADLIHLSGLTNLTSLFLHRVRVGGADLSHIAGLAKLIFLSLSATQVEGSDLSILEGLKNIKFLNLSRTQINGSGLVYLRGLTNMKSLDLGHCQIKKATNLRTLQKPNPDKLYLYGNPIQKLPRQLLGALGNNCKPALFAWLDATADSTRCETNQAFKLLFLGNGNVGKSSLLEALQNGKAAPKASTDSTEGIDLVKLPLEEATAYAWDFAGQEVFHGTHRLFLGAESVILIVFDPETEEYADKGEARADRIDGKEKVYDHPLEYWLQMAQQEAKDSQIIVVQNKRDVKPEVSKRARDLAGEYGAEFVHLSTHTGKGIRSLRAQILDAAEELNEYEMVIPSAWVKMRERMAANQLLPVEKRKRIISKSTFTKWCEEEGVFAASIDILLEFLHHNGFLYRLDDQNIILDQEWALEAIYALLKRGSDSGKILRREWKGKTTRNWILRSWGDKYTTAHQELFLNFMEKSGICYTLESDDKQEEEEAIYYVFPRFLPKRMPPLLQHYLHENKPAGFRFFNYTLAYPNYDRLRRLIVGLGKKAFVNQTWTDGIYLHSPARGHVLFYADWPNRQLKLSCEARHVDFWLGIADDILEEENRFEKVDTKWQEVLFDPAGDTPNPEEIPLAVSSSASKSLEASLAEIGPDKNQSGKYLLVISYAREDRAYVEDFLVHLHDLHPEIDPFYDQDLEANRPWTEALAERFERAAGYLIFTSPHYLNARVKKYIHEDEVPVMYQRMTQQQVPVYKVAARSVSRHAVISEELQAFNWFKDATPIPGKNKPGEQADFFTELIDKVIYPKFLGS